MRVPFFDVRIRDLETDQTIHRSWSRERLLDQVESLRSLNARGYEIGIRPSEDLDRPGLILVSDLTRSAALQMERDGREPAVLLETSPGHFQAWVRIPERASEPERAEIGRSLAREYGADLSSASPLQFGRLAGFKNERESDRGQDPSESITLLRSAPGREASDAYHLVRQADRALEEQAREASMQLRRESQDRDVEGLAASRLPHTAVAEREATDLCRRELERNTPGVAEASQRDFAAATRLVEVGYSARTIEAALRAASPDLEERTREAVDRYVESTTEQALRAHARQLARDLDRDRGMEL
jgi:hypothetical protein